MRRGEQAFAATDESASLIITTPDLGCRVCELEAENERLRLLVSELLVANQRLRAQELLIPTQEPDGLK